MNRPATPAPKWPLVACAALAASAALAVAAFLTGCPGDRKSVSIGEGAASYKEARALPAAATAAATPDGPGSGEGEWSRPSRDLGGTRFSPLAEIDRENVSRLELAWTFDTGVDRGQESAPLVVGDTMYLVTPFPNKLYALDLTAPPKLRWTYVPPTRPAAAGVACCDVVNRGVVYADGRLHYATLDDQLVGVDAATGKELWRTLLGDIQKGETMTMAPVVVKGKVLAGNSGGEFGVRGWLAAVDAATGQLAWRAYSTGPDADVLIGPDFKPHYESDKGVDLGVKSWPPGRWQTGGGTVWGWITYDPALDLLYYGTGNPGPWNPEERPGDNKWTAGIFARHPDTGAAAWFYQWSPHDLYDYDGINESILVDLEIDGRRRPVLVHPERNGYVYVLDRATGEVLSADPFATVTTSRGVDLSTGRLIPEPDMTPVLGKVVRGICPAAPGAKDFQPSAYSPRTGLVYIPHQNLCQDEEGTEASYIAGTPYVGANVRMKEGPGGQRGELLAWDPAARRAVWKIAEKFPVWSGTVVTAGDLVFYGTMDNWFKAVDAQTGKVLWQYHVDSGIIGQPVTYRGPDGRQYVAILAGVGGWAGAIVTGKLDARDHTAANGFAYAMRDLPQVTRPGGTLYVFALPRSGGAPAAPAPAPAAPSAPSAPGGAP